MKVSRNAEEQQRQAALSLLKRLPPKDLSQNLDDFVKIAPHLEQSLAAHVTRPLRVEKDPEQNRYFVACDYNCDNGVYRSPWSNKYFPSPAGGDDSFFRPSERLRRLEENFNEVFDLYKTSYYEGGVSSVYLWDLDEGFAGAFLIHKECSQDRDIEVGMWDAVHIVEVKELASSTAAVDYKLSTTVLFHLQVDKVDDSRDSSEETEVSCLITRQAEEKKEKR